LEEAVTTEQKPEAGEVISHYQAHGALTEIGGNGPPYALLRNYIHQQECTAASLAAAEAEYTKAERLWKAATVELEAAKSDAERGWNEVHGLQAELGQLNQQLAPERAGRERLEKAPSEGPKLSRLTSGGAAESGDEHEARIAVAWSKLLTEYSQQPRPFRAFRLGYHTARKAIEDDPFTVPAINQAERDEERFNAGERAGYERGKADGLAIAADESSSEGPAPPVAEGETELAAERVHDNWVQMKLAAGVTSRLSESGEELMQPYAQLSEAAKELDRGTVRAVLDALRSQPTPTGEAPQAAPVKHEINGHVFVGTLETVDSFGNCDRCGEQFGARYVRPCPQVAPAAEGEHEPHVHCPRCGAHNDVAKVICRNCGTGTLAMEEVCMKPLHEPASSPASDAGGESKFKPRCMVLVRGKHRCIKNDGHGPDNDLGDVVHIDAHGELFCEQGKLASPPSGQWPTEALRAIIAAAQEVATCKDAGYCDWPAGAAFTMFANKLVDELAKGAALAKLEDSKQ
jgi:ribosomal protein L40E